MRRLWRMWREHQRLVRAHDHGGWGDLTPRKGCYCQDKPTQETDPE